MHNKEKFIKVLDSVKNGNYNYKLNTMIEKSKFLSILQRTYHLMRDKICEGIENHSGVVH